MLNLKDTLNKKIIVYRQVDAESNKRYISAIQEISEDHIAIARPYYKRMPLTLKEQDIVKVRLLGEGEVFVLTHRYLGLKEDNIPLYLLSLPQNIERIQQRDYVRFSSILDIYYKEKINDDYLLGKSLDISGGGMKLTVAAPLDNGTMLELKFTLPGSERPIEVDAKVVRNEIIEVSRGKINTVGLRFIGMPVGIQERIISFIFAKMAEWRRMTR